MNVSDAGKSKVTTYGYDGMNRRTFKASQGQVQVSYLYDGLEVLQEVAGTDSERIMAYYRANNQIVSRQEYSGLYENPPREEQQFYIYDGLGSVSALATERGEITDRYRYDAFGEFTKTLNSEENPEDVFNNTYTFTGRRFDAESGLYNFHFRQYDLGTGVWTTPDPIGVLGGLNLYSYVENNPVNWFDLLGLTMSAGELGIGNPGSYGGENTNESMYGDNGRGTGNDFGEGGGIADTILNKTKNVLTHMLPATKNKVSMLSRMVDVIKDLFDLSKKDPVKNGTDAKAAINSLTDIISDFFGVPNLAEMNKYGLLPTAIDGIDNSKEAQRIGLEEVNTEFKENCK